MEKDLLLQQFDLLATAPGGVAKLRELILTLAVQGKLVPQDPADEPASTLLQRIRAEKDRLIAAGKIKRDKLLAPIGGDEQPFGLPNGWEWVRIPDICYSLGQGEPTARFSYIDVAAIDNEKGRVAQELQVLDATDAPSRARKFVAQGTVLYSTVRPYLKNIAVVERVYQPEAIASTAFAVMHPHTGVQSQYLLHYLRSQPFTEFVNSKAVGVAYPAINDANFFQGVVPLPPLLEQTRIVTRVEELMRVCDALETQDQLQAMQHTLLVNTLLATLTASATPEELADNWQRVAQHFDTLLDRPSAVDALEQSILQLAVRGQLVPQDPTDEPASELLKRIRAEKDRLIATGKIKRDKPLAPIGEDEQPFDLPQGWKWVRLGDVWQSSFYGPRFGNEEYVSKGGIPTIRTTDMSNGQIVLKNPPFVNVPLDKYDAYLVQRGDLLVTRSGSIGVMALFDLDIDAVPSAYLIRLRFSELMLPKYCFEYFLSELGQRQLGLSTTAVGVPNVSASKMADFAFPLPPLPEQARIVARVAHLRRLCAELLQRLTQSQTTQAALAEALVESV